MPDTAIAKYEPEQVEAQKQRKHQIRPATHWVSMDEPAWGIAERVGISADSKGFHRWRTITVGRTKFRGDDFHEFVTESAAFGPTRHRIRGVRTPVNCNPAIQKPGG